MPGNTEDDELTLPRASINKMIKELVPSVRIANEARELVLNCCTEFIHLLSSEANEICNQLNKKTINAEHVLMGKFSIVPCPKQTFNTNHFSIGQIGV